MSESPRAAYSQLPQTEPMPRNNPFESMAFLEGLAAASAIIAYADGKLDSEERSAYLAAARAEKSLSQFSLQSILDAFTLHTNNFERDPEQASQKAKEKLKLLAGRPDEARCVLKVCQSVLEADGLTHPSEIRALDEIERMLGLLGTRRNG
jgi:tellurite resistance protein